MRCLVLLALVGLLCTSAVLANAGSVSLYNIFSNPSCSCCECDGTIGRFDVSLSGPGSPVAKVVNANVGYINAKVSTMRPDYKASLIWAYTLAQTSPGGSRLIGYKLDGTVAYSYAISQFNPLGVQCAHIDPVSNSIYAVLGVASTYFEIFRTHLSTGVTEQVGRDGRIPYGWVWRDMACTMVDDVMLITSNYYDQQAMTVNTYVFKFNVPQNVSEGVLTLTAPRQYTGGRTWVRTFGLGVDPKTGNVVSFTDFGSWNGIGLAIVDVKTGNLTAVGDLLSNYSFGAEHNSMVFDFSNRVFYGYVGNFIPVGDGHVVALDIDSAQVIWDAPFSVTDYPSCVGLGFFG
eukprot:ANDGO_00546.mRNA.1 hypothetical protein